MVSSSPPCKPYHALIVCFTRTDEIRKALKAVDLMKILDGQVALGSKSGTKDLGEHKVRTV